MEETATWRHVLGKAVSDTQERQRIAGVVKINPVTLTRWANGKSNPRLESLYLLLDALPDYRHQFEALIPHEFPEFRSQPSKEEAETYSIPSPFYARVFTANANALPLLRTSSICILVLQQMLAQLDPNKEGMIIMIAQCTKPAPTHKVRSLYLTYGRGTPPWHTHTVQNTHLLGAESLLGRAALTGHSIVAHHPEELPTIAHCHPEKALQSALACPLLLADTTPGSLFVGSIKPKYFSLALQDLIQSYADLLAIAFGPHEFYPLSELDLGIFPSLAVQRPYLAHIQEAISQRMIEAAHRNVILTRPQAEALAWLDMEEQLLNVTLTL